MELFSLHDTLQVSEENPGVSKRWQDDMSVAQPFTIRSLSTAAYLPDQRAIPDSPQTDGEHCVAGIFANPFDSGPRAGLADWLEESGGDAEWASRLRDYPGGMYLPIPALRYFHRWHGPGFLGYDLESGFGTVNVWAGLFIQFPQACRSRLFIDYPITLVLLTDRQPLQDGKTFVWCDSEAILRRFDQEAGHYQDRTFPMGAYSHVINELCGVFMAADDRFITPDGSGVYRANNPNCANLALSNALVNIGRYAVGLPTIRFPLQGVNQYSGVSRVISTALHEESTWGMAYRQTCDRWLNRGYQTHDPTSIPDLSGHRTIIWSLWQMVRQSAHKTVPLTLT